MPEVLGAEQASTKAAQGRQAQQASLDCSQSACLQKDSRFQACSDFSPQCALPVGVPSCRSTRVHDPQIRMAPVLHAAKTANQGACPGENGRPPSKSQVLLLPKNTINYAHDRWRKGWRRGPCSIRQGCLAAPRRFETLLPPQVSGPAYQSRTSKRMTWIASLGRG